MEQPPDFLTTPLSLTDEENFKPAVVPRKGEMIAWGAALLIGAVAIVQRVQTGQFPCLTITLFLLFLLAAILISFSYWVDSRTIIHLTRSQLSYKSPFRRFLQGWQQISEIQVMKAGHLWRVLVIGQESSFTVRIGSNQSTGSKSTGILGIHQGDKLVRIICGMANLSEIHKTGESWTCKKPL